MRLVIPGSSFWLWPVRRARSPLATSLQGMTLCRLEPPRRVLAAHGALALLGFTSLGHSPSLLSASRSVPPARVSTPGPAIRHGAYAPRRRRRLAILSHLGEAPLRVLLPVPQSFKEQGSWLVSFETAGPSEVCVLVPLALRQGGCRTS
jgi:hypothetical protein